MKADVRLMLTADGSHTAINQTFDKTYHSVYGALQESQRVYIELGLYTALAQFPGQELSIFDMGFGTGLNALLTVEEASKHPCRVSYTTIDAYPMALEDARQLNFDQLLQTNHLNKLHEALWNEPVIITPYFTLTKIESRVQDWQTDQRFHLIYYDAFAPSAQPELWEPEIFLQMAQLLLPGGVLTTYCSKSYVQRNLRTAGFQVEKHPGPLHKRDVLRAVKI